MCELKDAQFLNINSGAIHIENKLDLLPRQLWLYLVYKALPVMKTGVTSFKINLSELKNSIGYNSKNNKYLKQALKDLVNTTVEWNIFNKEQEIWGCSSLLSDCEIVTNSNIATCEYSFSQKIIERFINPNMYLKLNLFISKEFTSKHSLSIYCLALDYLNIKENYSEKNFSIEDMRKYLGIEPDMYSRVVDLNRRIIKKAEHDINSQSDMKISIKPIYVNKNKIIGFKFQMSIKEDFLSTYKPQKFIKPVVENKQTNLFEIPLDAEPKKNIIQNSKIQIEDKALKEFFSEYKISITTNTVQQKLTEIKEKFHDKFEDYLSFLMKYTKQELKRNNIKNIPGFYVGLLKDDNQLENYITDLPAREEYQKLKQNRVKVLLDNELKNEYQKYLSKEFENFLFKNINELEVKIVDIIKSTAKPGEFFYDVIISRHNNGLIDKTLLTETKAGTKSAVINHLKNYKDNFGYNSLTFNEWQTQEVTEEYVKNLEKKLLN